MKKHLHKLLWIILLVVFNFNILTPHLYALTNEVIDIYSAEESIITKEFENTEKEIKDQMLPSDEFNTDEYIEENSEKQEEIISEETNKKNELENEEEPELITGEEFKSSDFPLEEQVRDFEIIGEDITKRERNVKHIITETGTYQAFVYPSSVHYEVDGKWEDIDNTLIRETDEKGEEVIRNKKNDFKVEFSANIKESKLNESINLNKQTDIEDSKIIYIKNDKFFMKWSMEKTNRTVLKKIDRDDLKQVDKIKNNETTKDTNVIADTDASANEVVNTDISKDKIDNKYPIATKDINSNTKYKDKIQNLDSYITKEQEESEVQSAEKSINKIKDSYIKDSSKRTSKEIDIEKVELTQITSSVAYSNIMDDVDLEYDVTSDYVKETIVLKSESSVKNSYIFNMDLGNSTLKLNEDNSIDILDATGEKVALIEAPYMWDSIMNYSTDIMVILEKDEGLESNIYKMEIIPNLEWLEDEERVYPVKIDPTITTSLERKDIEDALIISEAPYAVAGPVNITLKSGRAVTGVHRSLLKFNLPTLNAGDQVTYAELSLINYPHTWEWNPWKGGKIQVNAHKVTSNWSDSTACWANSAEIYDSSRSVDYAIYQYTDSEPVKEYTWDITAIAKDWYTTGNNYGLMLKENNDSSPSGHESAFFYSAKIGDNVTGLRPMAIIEYRNQTGLENYLSYHEQNLGRAGTGYVNDYNGNLVITNPDVTTPGNRMPVSINHVFNTNEVGKDLGDIGYGMGWKLNITQTISMETIPQNGVNVEYARYMDEDGTRHYFKRDGTTNTYLDEDGLGLTLTKNSDLSFTMKDKADNIMTFERKVLSGVIEWWHLKEIKDVNGNKITISFSSGPNLALFYPNKITDGTGTAITINWGGNGRISSIVDQAGRTTSYIYDSYHRLIKIIYPDLKEVIYSYDSRGLLTSVKNIDNSHIDYTYYPSNNTSLSYRIKTVAEYSTDNQIGNSFEMVYGNNTTTFIDNNGYTSVYSFNNYGNLIGISDYGNNRNDLNKAMGKSYDFGTVNDGSKNKLTFESKMESSEANMIINPSFERNSTWGRGCWYLDSGTIDYVSNTKYAGNLAIKVTATNSTSNSRQFAYQSINNLVSGKTYTLSAYMKTDNVTNTNSGGALIYMYYQNQAGVKVADSEIIAGTTDWKRYSVTFTYGEKGTGSMYISLGIQGETGTAYFDCVQLEETPVPNSYNYIENPSFDDLLTSWNKSPECTVNDIVGVIGVGNAAILRGEPTKWKSIIQVISLSGSKGDVFKISSWVQNFGTPNNEIGGTSKPYKISKIIAVVNKTDGTQQRIDIDINPDTKEWKYISDVFVTDGSYNNIEIHFVFAYQYNDIVVKNISLYKDEGGQSYQYDKNGNLINAQDLAKQNSSLEYNGKNELIKQTNPKGGSFVYEYDSQYKNRLVKAINNSKVEYSFKYDNYGNVTSSKINNNTTVNSTNQDDIESGEVYCLRNKYTGKYLDYSNQIDENNVVMVQRTYNGGASQKWRIVKNANGSYKLISHFSNTGRALGYLSQKIDPNGYYTAIYEYSESNVYEEWFIQKQADGTFVITAKSNGWALAVHNNSPVDNMVVGLHNSVGDLSKYWILEPVNLFYIEEGASYKLKNKNSGLYVGVNNGSDFDGANVEQVVDGTTQGQEWIFTNLNNGYYKITNKNSKNGRVMDVLNANTNNSANVQLLTYHGGAGQQWEIVPAGNGAHYIKPRHTRGVKALDVYGGYLTPGTNIHIYQSNGSAALQYQFEKTAGANSYIETNAEYTQDGRFLNKLIDARGKEVTYAYNFNSQAKTGIGTLQSTTNAKGNITEYTYDNLDRLTRVSLTDGNNTYQNQYQYIDDKLSKITHNGFDINFIYDGWGNKQSVSVGSQSLITNTYAEKNRTINKCSIW